MRGLGAMVAGRIPDGAIAATCCAACIVHRFSIRSEPMHGFRTVIQADDARHAPDGSTGYFTPHPPVRAHPPQGAAEGPSPRFLSWLAGVPMQRAPPLRCGGRRDGGLRAGGGSKGHQDSLLRALCRLRRSHMVPNLISPGKADRDPAVMEGGRPRIGREAGPPDGRPASFWAEAKGATGRRPAAGPGVRGGLPTDRAPRRGPGQGSRPRAAGPCPHGARSARPCG